MKNTFNPRRYILGWKIVLFTVFVVAMTIALVVKYRHPQRISPAQTSTGTLSGVVMQTGTGVRVYSSTSQVVPSAVCFRGMCFDLELARTEPERRLGLMNRTQLAETSGMLFIFDTDDRYEFWMKNTLIALDMIWLDTQMRVVDIQTATPCVEDPCPSYPPRGPARYVLEIKGGMSNIIGLKVGDVLEVRE